MPPEPDPGEMTYMRSLAPQLDQETMATKWEYATENYRSGGEYSDSGLITLESPFGSSGVAMSGMGGHVSSAHSHPPAGEYVITKNDLGIVESGHKIGERLRISPMHFSPQDVRNMRQENRPGWVVQAGTGKMLYFPINNNPNGVHY